MPPEPNQSNENVGVTKGWRRRIMALPRKFYWALLEMMLEIKKPGQEDPRRVIHSLKVGSAITLVSTFYYLDPLYNGFGSSAMWAVFTVIVVSEFTVGATLGKGLNRGLATFLACVLGLGSYYVADQTGGIAEPILLGISVFLLAAGVTYIRFFPQIKARYDYGLLVFILTFCLVSVSSFREDEIIDIAKKRFTTILIGGFIAVVVCIFVYPFWAGDDLHNLVLKNIQTLGNFLQGFGDQYFETAEAAESKRVSLQGYKSVLNSKQNEENLANFARWEPRHGRFKFRHPWQQYLKIGSLSRQCAYRIDALNGYLNSADQTPPKIRSKIQEPCIKMSKETGKALEELSKSIEKMIPPSAAESHITKSKTAATNLRGILETGLWEETNLLESIPAITVASLLVDVVSCTEKLAESIKELATLAKFNNACRKIAPEDQEVQPSAGDDKPPHRVIRIDQFPACPE